MTSDILSRRAWREIAASLKISRRQLDVVRGIVDGKTESAAAQALGISPHTVHTHVERIQQKLGVHDRLDLVLRVFQEFIALTLDPDSNLPSLCHNRLARTCPIGGRKLRKDPGEAG